MSRQNLLRPSDTERTPGFFKRLRDQIENLLDGKTRNVGSVTLTESTTTTTVDDPRFESHQTVILYPLTANAAAVVASTYVSSRTNKQFVITHPSDANTDKDFGYLIAG